MKAIFISDAHLYKSSDERYIKLMNFLDAVQNGRFTKFLSPPIHSAADTFPDVLFFAGDLFDFWLCTKEKINPEFTPLLEKLIQLKKKGLRIHLSEGNHDFFLKDYFEDVLGMDVGEEATVTEMDHLKCLIAHGDTVDRTNTPYLFFRKILRSRAFYHFHRAIPSSLRWTIARFCSVTSKELTEEKGTALQKKMADFALTKFREGFDAVILGHCHVPSLQYYDLENKKRIFATLGDWTTHYSFLFYENGNFSLGYYVNL